MVVLHTTGKGFGCFSIWIISRLFQESTRQPVPDGRPIKRPTPRPSKETPVKRTPASAKPPPHRDAAVKAPETAHESTTKETGPAPKEEDRPKKKHGSRHGSRRRRSHHGEGGLFWLDGWMTICFCRHRESWREETQSKEQPAQTQGQGGRQRGGRQGQKEAGRGGEDKGKEGRQQAMQWWGS